MKNLKDAKTKIFPSKTRGGKELPSSSALDSPSIMSKLATPPHAINPDMSQVIDAATVGERSISKNFLRSRKIYLGEA